MTPAGTNLLLAHAAAAAPVTGVTKSLRFNGGDSPSLSRTYTSNATWTFSVWVKRSELGATNNLLGTVVQFNSSDQLVTPNLTTTAVYRDVGAWYHICVSDSGLFVNGVQVTGTVSTSALSDAWVGDSFDGYLSDVHLIDGTALDATSFAEEDSNGQWVPKAYSGSYGTEGFHLDFKEDSPTSGSNAGIGKDVSGNGNYFNTTNLASSDVVEDTPQRNYSTLNILDNSGGLTLTEGNLKYDTSGWNEIRGTIGVSSGKWYYEVYVDNYDSLNEAFSVGIAEVDGQLQSTYWSGSWDNAVNGRRYGVNLNGTTVSKIEGGSETSISATISSGDVISILLDLDSVTTTLKFWVNGANEETLFSSLAAGTYAIGFNSYKASLILNAGQDPTFAGDDPVVSPATSEFAYTPTSGYTALSAGEFAAPTIAKGVTYFDTKIYDDGAGAKTFDNGTVSMQPDLVWVKSRGSAYDHKLTDSVRGVEEALESNTTDTEATDSDGLTVFGSDGFTVGLGSAYSDTTGDGMVAWCWKGGTSHSHENYNATAGFSIITWTGDSSEDSTQEISHSLGVAPEFIIAKNRTDDAGGTGSWIVYHKDLTSGYNLILNDTAGEYQPDSPLIENVDNNSVDFGNDSMSFTSTEYLNGATMDEPAVGETYVAYLFASVNSYSKIGSFSGSSTAFIYTSFRPAFILAKRSDSSGGNWLMFDDKREGYNVDNDDLMANDTAVEAITDHIDILSNGFKIRTSDVDLDGGTVIYLAVAKNPFKYASAR